MSATGGVAVQVGEVCRSHVHRWRDIHGYGTGTVDVLVVGGGGGGGDMRGGGGAGGVLVEASVAVTAGDYSIVGRRWWCGVSVRERAVERFG